MKININYYKDNIKWKSNWVFIGKYYSNLKYVEKKNRWEKIEYK